MKGVVCVGRVEELGRQLGQASQFCAEGCEEKEQSKENFKGAAIQKGLGRGR
jgi:hypothetical protein